MSRETIYLVQGFKQKGASLKAQPASQCKNEEAARRAAQRLSETHVGAVAFSTSADAELGDYDEEPVVLLVVGTVPESFGGG